MKHIQTTMFKALVFTFAFWISQSMTALTIDGIVYQLNPSLKTASVVRKNAGNSSLPGWYYSGYIKIPSEVVYNDVTYTVTTIEEKAFGSCTELTAIKIPESITTIGAQAFLGCIGLTFVTIPNSVTSIGDYAFGGCSGLKTIDIPNNVKTIGIGAFSYCTSATSIAISENITSIPESAFANCSCLTSINIPNKVEKIGARAFEGCRDLTSVTIGNGVTTIDVGAFSKCSSMTSINIPNNVMNINQDVFQECKDITDLYCYAESTPSTGSNIFVGADVQYATLHVPAASIESYKSTAPWNGFGKIVALDDVPEPSQCSTMPGQRCSTLMSMLFFPNFCSIS